MSLIKELQQQIAGCLVTGLENQTIAPDRITFIARRIEMLFPPSLSDDQVVAQRSEITSIPEFSDLPIISKLNG